MTLCRWNDECTIATSPHPPLPYGRGSDQWVRNAAEHEQHSRLYAWPPPHIWKTPRDLLSRLDLCDAPLVRRSLARHDTVMSTDEDRLFSFRLDPRIDPSAMDRLLTDVARAGFNAVEWPVSPKGLLTPVTPESDCRILAERFRDAGLSIASS